MKAMKRIITFLIIIILILISVIFCLLSKDKKEKNTGKNIVLEYGDSFSDVELINEQEKTVKLKQSEKLYQLVIYLDTKCSACMKELSAVKHYEEIFGTEYIDISLVWADKIPNMDLEKYNIKGKSNYRLKNGVIRTSTPTGYILDKNNQIIYFTEETDSLTTKLMTLEGISKENVIENANRYLNSQRQSKEDKPFLVYFAMDGCKDCKAADSIVFGDKIKEKYEVLELYDSTSYGNHKLIDIDEIFLSIYKIDWYPSFLLFDKGAFRTVGQVNIDDLEKELLKPVGKS